MSAREAVGLPALTATFLKIGTFTFGGSLQGWIFREVVERRRWIERERFLSGMTLAQILPGANPVNLAVFVGHATRGATGALLAVLAMVAPALVIVLMLGAAFRRYGQIPLVHFVLGGMAAAGVGLTLATGLKVSRTLPMAVRTVCVATVVFIAVGILRRSMIETLLWLMPVSIGWSAAVADEQG